MRLGQRGLDLLFPPKCPFCQRVLDDPRAPLCPRCQHSLPWLTGAAGARKLEFISLCVSPLRYQDPVRGAVQRYKFQPCPAYAAPFGLLAAQCVRDHLDGRYDLISWPPVSPKRRRTRGFDQAEKLALAAARELGAPAVPTLRKLRDTPAQSTLEEDSARRANVLGVYELLPGADVAGARILLADDVVTSGSTLSECAGVLLRAGASEILAVTLAQAGTNP